MLRRLCRSASLAVSIAVLLAGAGPAPACGPFFPNRLLMNGDEAVLWAPVADFAFEMGRLRPDGAPPFRAIEPPRVEYDQSAYARQTADADRADLHAALRALKLPAERVERLSAQHDAWREAVRAHADLLAERAWNASEAAPPELPSVALPEGLPAEFDLYVRGAAAYYRAELGAAREAWQAVLALPRAQRQYRSTWAAFMLGKSWLVPDPAQAIQYFQQTRALVQEGFTDSLGLASSSLGWEANAELKRNQLERAIDLYLQQLATGDSTAIWSLRLVAARILRDGEPALQRAARDEDARRVITAYLLAHGGPPRSIADAPPETLTEQWLKVIESAGVRELSGADRLAWIAYQAGAFEAAERWLRVVPKQSGIGHWIRAKLAFRAGQVNQAAAELALAARTFPPDEEWSDLSTDFGDGYMGSELSPAGRAQGELGLLRLARRQYVEALDALLRGGYWMDAAYVAERVLTIDELRQYVEQHWPAARAEVEEATLPPGADAETGADAGEFQIDAYWAAQRERAALRKQGEANVRIRHLLARRLARAGRLEQARSYYPRRYQAALDAYTRNLQRGQNRNQSQLVRARALWEAARLTRYRGLELLGSELEPDWYAAGEGNYELGRLTQARDRQGPETLTASSADERERALANAVMPDKRWHYRYRAADLAWRAAEMLPDETDETARVLCEAGSWLKARDPQAAERFYKALVRRCGTTALGREAQQLHWFPKLPAVR